MPRSATFTALLLRYDLYGPARLLDEELSDLRDLVQERALLALDIAYRSEAVHGFTGPMSVFDRYAGILDRLDIEAANRKGFAVSA